MAQADFEQCNGMARREAGRARVTLASVLQQPYVSTASGTHDMTYFGGGGGVEFIIYFNSILHSRPFYRARTGRGNFTPCK